MALELIASGKVVPKAIEIDRYEAQRLKAHSLISVEFYVSVALKLTYGQNSIKLSQDQLTVFCERWSFDYDEYVSRKKGRFELLAEDVLIAVGKLSKKEGSNVSCEIQLSLNLEEKQ